MLIVQKKLWGSVWIVELCYCTKLSLGTNNVIFILGEEISRGDKQQNYVPDTMPNDTLCASSKT